MIAVNFFWFMGAAFQTNIFLYAKEMMKGTPEIAGYLIVVIAIGVGAGSFIAARLEREGGAGTRPDRGIWNGDFCRGSHVGLWFPYFGRFFSISSSWVPLPGSNYIPLVSLIQWRCPATDRGRVMATTNFLSFVAIATAAGVLWVFGTVFHFNSAQVFLALGVVAAAGTFGVCRYVPDSLLRLILYVLTNIFYRTKIIGRKMFR